MTVSLSCCMHEVSESRSEHIPDRRCADGSRGSFKAKQVKECPQLNTIFHEMKQHILSDQHDWMNKALKASLPAMGIFCLALLVRVIYNITAARGYTPIYDAAIYNNLAHSLLSEQCYCYAPHHLTVFRPPLWPFIIAAIYAIVGEQNAYVRLLCGLLGSGTCMLVYLLARDLFGKWIALITGIVASIYTGLFLWDAWLYTESLYTFLLTFFIYSLTRFQRSRRTAWAITGGLVLGLALLTRPNGALLVAIVCAWAVILILAKILPWREALRTVCLVVAIAALINIPWMIRNYTVTHSFMPVSTLGTTLHGAYNNDVLPVDRHLGPQGQWWLPRYLNPDFTAYRAANEQADLARALTWMRNNPGGTLQLFQYHLENMWTPYFYSYGLAIEEYPNTPWAKIIGVMIPYSIVVFILAAFGLILTWRQKKIYLVAVYLVLIVTIVQNVVFYGSPRFRAPIEPLLVLLVGGALWWIYGRAAALLHAIHRAIAHSRFYHKAGGSSLPTVRDRTYYDFPEKLSSRKSK